MTVRWTGTVPPMTEQKPDETPDPEVEVLVVLRTSGSAESAVAVVAEALAAHPALARLVLLVTTPAERHSERT